MIGKPIHIPKSNPILSLQSLQPCSNNPVQTFFALESKDQTLKIKSDGPNKGIGRGNRRNMKLKQLARSQSNLRLMRMGEGKQKKPVSMSNVIQEGIQTNIFQAEALVASLKPLQEQ